MSCPLMKLFLSPQVRNVTEDEVYEFRVCAVNKAGEGPYSQGSNPVKAAEPKGTLTQST